MQRWKFPISFLVLPLLLFLFSCTEEQKVEEQLSKKWELKAELGPDGNNLGRDTDNRFLHLKYDKNTKKARFTHTLSSPNDTLNGAWRISNDTLFIAHDPYVSTSIDSLNSTIDPVTGEPRMIIYVGGSEITRFENGKWTPKTVEVAFKIKTQSFDELVLKDIRGGMTFKMQYKSEVKESGMSFVSILRGLLGLATLLAIAWVFSSNRKAIAWDLVFKGLLIQIIFAICILKVPFVESMFEAVSSVFVKIINFTEQGTRFLFGQFSDGQINPALDTFIVKVLPTIIFFSALTSLFYYWGILQKIVFAFAWVMKRFMKLSGAESLAAAGNIFLGQTEAPLLVRPYLLNMTKSEIMCLMTGGMATIAGGVLAAYMGFLGGGDPAQELYFAKHLLAASVMSAPAAIVAAKMLVPESEQIKEEMKIPKDKIGTNALEAIANGTTDGIKLAVNVAAMLLVFIALMAMANFILGWCGGWYGINDSIAENTEYKKLSFEFLLGYAVAPITWMMGVPAGDTVYVGELLGTKTILNEFVGYIRLGELKNSGAMSEKGIIMSTYMLCGFANFASIGIQIGGIGALVPSRKGLLSSLGIRALIGGTLACLFTAVVVGMLI
jgi:CNT family concentrative nucleoside transporter